MKAASSLSVLSGYLKMLAFPVGCFGELWLIAKVSWYLLQTFSASFIEQSINLLTGYHQVSLEPRACCYITSLCLAILIRFSHRCGLARAGAFCKAYTSVVKK